MDPQRSPVRRASRHRRARGFTLIELMVVVVIIGILAAIALPAYLNYVRKSNRSEAMSALSTVAADEERYYSDNNTYTTTGTLVGVASSGLTEHGYYKVTIAACSGGSISNCYLLTATAQGAQAKDTGCTSLTLDSTGTKSPAACWK